MAQVTPSPKAGKDLAPYQKLPRSAFVSYMQKAVMDAGHRQKIAAFLPGALLGWFGHYLRSRIGKRHKFLTYVGLENENGVYPLRDESLIGGPADPKGEIRLGLVGDWGTGTDEANAVVQRMMQLKPHYTIHLGDVYYVGDQPEMDENCLGKESRKGFIPCTWPVGSVGSFAMNGNHEMYALGNAYFDSFLKVLGMRPAVDAAPSGQKASYFCLQNDDWQIIALDTGYNSVGIPILEYIFRPDSHLRAETIDWLRNDVNPKGNKRGLIILSHHQYFPGFEEMYTKPAEQLHDLIDRPVLWFWGHEHRMAVYGQAGTPKGIQAFGRCIGHGGMPVDITQSAVEGTKFPPIVYDHRPYEPPGEDITVGINGFTMLVLTGSKLRVDYYDFTVNQGPLLTEQREVQNGKLLGKNIACGDDNLHHKLTVVGNLNQAIGK